MSENILYHAPPSFYSQIARIVLTEKNVPWTSYVAVAGPPIFETYKPWYIRLNPNGTIPTFVHDGAPITDSIDIAFYVESNFAGPSLVPEDDGSKEEMQKWLATLQGIKIRDLTYGSPRLRRLGAFFNQKRVKVLEKHKRENTDLAGCYDAKIKDIKSFMYNALDSSHVDKVRKQTLHILDDLNSALEERHWIAGKSYSLADAVWTVAIGRFHMLDLDPLSERPHLLRWYACVKERPSFKQADIWEKFKPQKLFITIAKKFPFQFGIVIVSINVLVYFLSVGMSK